MESLASRGKLSKRARRILRERESKDFESRKKSLSVPGKKTSETVKKLMNDLSQLRLPDVIRFTKKNNILPFEDASSLEFFSLKRDAGLFMFGSHNKKRPDNITFGRFFNHKLYDMYEFGVVGFRTSFRSKSSLFPFPGARPCLIFQGDAFEHSSVMTSVRNMFLDFFRGDDVGSVPLEQLQWVMVFTAESDKLIHFRHYHISNQRSTTPKVPHVDLEEIGPHFSLNLRRFQEAPTDLAKQATRRAKSVLTHMKRGGDGTQPAKLAKNVTRDEMGSVLGRVHVGRQDLKDLVLRKMKGLGKKRGRPGKDTESGVDASEAIQHESERKKKKE